MQAIWMWIKGMTASNNTPHNAKSSFPNATVFGSTPMGLKTMQGAHILARKEKGRREAEVLITRSNNIGPYHPLSPPPMIWAPLVFSSIVTSSISTMMPDPLKASQPWLLLLLLLLLVTLFIDVHWCPTHCNGRQGKFEVNFSRQNSCKVS